MPASLTSDVRLSVKKPRHIVFDWGDTLMADDPTNQEPMFLWPTLTVFPDAQEVLPYLATRATLSVATNAMQSDEAMIRKALARVSIDAYFGHIFCFRSVGKKKTDPVFWRFLMSALVTGVDEMWMVGDSFEGDIIPPSQLGIHSIWVNRRTEEVRSGDSFRTIRDLRELKELV